MSSNQSGEIQENILIVDDTPNNLRLLSTMLAEQGYKVRSVINGKMALTAAQAAPPDLILLDINMPQMNGYELCQKLKSIEKTCEIPVIFISALDEVLDKVKAFSVGGVDYITKPFQLEEVLVRVQNQLALRRLSKRLQEQNALLQQEIHERKVVQAALEKANQELERLATLDGLTQVANRRRFDEYLLQEWRRLKREQSCLSLIMCDVDYFKCFNDTYGHQAGDDCLRKVARAICKTVKRPADLVARYGGEEFAIVLPNTPLEGAILIAQFMHESIEELKIPNFHSSVSQYVTLSVGVSSTIPDCHHTPEDLIAVVDKALYQAKQQGRNQTAIRQNLD